MIDVGHWRLKDEDEPPKSVSKLAFFVSQYDGTRVKREHDHACDRALRAIDGLRAIKALGPAAPKPKTHRKGGAYHHIGKRA